MFESYRYNKRVKFISGQVNVLIRILSKVIIHYIDPGTILRFLTNIRKLWSRRYLKKLRKTLQKDEKKTTKMESRLFEIISYWRRIKIYRPETAEYIDSNGDNVNT